MTQKEMSKLLSGLDGFRVEVCVDGMQVQLEADNFLMDPVAKVVYIVVASTQQL